MIKRLVDFPEEAAEAPAWVFEALREIDPLAEIICVEEGQWWVGAVKKEAARCEEGRKTLNRMWKEGWEKNDETRWPQIRNALLMSQGFGLIGKYRFQQGKEGWSAMIEDLRYSDYMWRKYEGEDEAVQEFVNGEAEENVRMRVAARIVDAMKADQRYMFKKLRSGVSVGATA